MPVDAGTIYSEIRIALDKLGADIAQVNAKFDKFGVTNTRQAQHMETSWKKSFGGIQAGGLAAITALTFAFKKAVSTFATTEQSLANVRAVTGATAEEFEILKKAADEAGRTTRFTAGQSADALYYLASAGFSAQQSVDALNGVLTLAGATGSDLAKTSETVASAISAFNLEAKDADRVANVFAASISNSQATMDKLAVSMRYIAPVASAFNQTIEGTAGLLQILYNNGFEASQAGTALRSSLSDLANKSSPAIAKLKELGVSFDEVNPQTNSYADIIEVLNKKVTDSSDVLSIFGDRAGPAMIKLIQAGRDEIEKYTDAVTDTNSAAEQYAIQNDTLAGSWDKMKSALEGTTNSIFEQLAPAFRLILDLISKVLNFITSMPASLKAVAGGMGTAAIAVGILSKAMSLLGIASSAALGPIGLILGLVVGLGSAIYNATKPAREMAQSFKIIAESSADAEQDTSGLIDRFRELKTKTELTVDEQEEYYKIIEKLKKSIPGLTDELLDNEEALLREAIAQKEANKAKTQAALDKAIQKQLEYRKEVEEAEEDLKKYNYELYKQLKLQGQLDAYLRENVFSYGVAAESVKNMQEVIDEGQNSINLYNSELNDLNEQLKSFTKDVVTNTDALDDNNDSLGEGNDLIKTREGLWAEYKKAFKQAQFEEEVGLISTADLLKEKIKITEDYLRSLYETGFDDSATFERFVGYINEYKKQLEELGDKDKEVTEERLTYAEGYAQVMAEMMEKEKEEQDALYEYYKNKRLEREEQERIHAEEMKKINEQMFDGIYTLTKSFFDTLAAIYEQDTDNRIDEIKQKVKEGTLTEEEGNKRIAQLEYQKQLTSWENQGLQIAADIIAGIAKALSVQDYIGAAITGAQGVMLGIQHALKRPKPPRLQAGGITLPQPGGVNTILAENGSPEVSFNLGASGEPFLNAMADKVAERIGGGYIHNTINVDGKVIAEGVARYFNDGIVEVDL